MECTCRLPVLGTCNSTQHSTHQLFPNMNSCVWTCTLCTDGGSTLSTSQHISNTLHKLTHIYGVALLPAPEAPRSRPHNPQIHFAVGVVQAGRAESPAALQATTNRNPQANLSQHRPASRSDASQNVLLSDAVHVACSSGGSAASNGGISTHVGTLSVGARLELLSVCGSYAVLLQARGPQLWRYATPAVAHHAPCSPRPSQQLYSGGICCSPAFNSTSRVPPGTPTTLYPGP